MGLVKLITANGSSLDSLGTVEIIVNFKNIEFPLQCLVVKNLIGPNMLGTDFLNLYNANINFVRKQLVLTGDKGLAVLKFDETLKK